MNTFEQIYFSNLIFGDRLELSAAESMEINPEHDSDFLQFEKKSDKQTDVKTKILKSSETKSLRRRSLTMARSLVFGVSC